MADHPRRRYRSGRLRARATFAAAARLPWLSLTATLEHREARVAIPIEGGRGGEHRAITEEHLLPALRWALAVRSGAFVDVGAFTGQTLIKLLLVEPARDYVGFEPQLSAAAYVAKLLEANRARGSVICAALGDRNGAAELRASGALDDRASVVGGFRPPERYSASHPVAMICGDDALAILGRGAGVLKIDAEGAELEVLRGLARTIERDRPVIFCELLPVGPADSPVAGLRRDRLRSVEELLAEASYRIFGIDDRGGLVAMPSPGDGPPSPRDFVCVPAGEADELVAAIEATGDAGA